MQQLFKYQTVEKLANYVQTTDGLSCIKSQVKRFDLVDKQDISKINLKLIEDAYPLATIQKGMLFHSKLKRNSSTFHDVFSFNIQGEYNRNALQNALNEVVARHPILRTSFDLINFSQPMQLVYKKSEILVDEYNLLDYSNLQQEQRIEESLVKERTHEFDWNKPSLCRVIVHIKRANSFQFTISFHHAVLDGWSVAVMLTELFELYGKSEAIQLDLPKEVSNYRDFIAEEIRVLKEPRAREYWKKTLQEFTVTSIFDRHFNKGIDRYDEESTNLISAKIPTHLTNRCRNLASKYKIPLKNVYLAAHMRALSIFSGQSDVVSGVLTNGRLDDAGGDRTLGVFLNSVPFRMNLSGGTWASLIKDSFRIEQEMFPYRNFPYIEIRKQQNNSPLFNVLFNFINFHVYREVELNNGLKVLGTDVFEQSDVPILVQLSQNPLDMAEVKLELYYKQNCFEQYEIRQYSEMYIEILQRMTTDPMDFYEDCNLMGNGIRKKILEMWNETEDTIELNQNLHRKFEEQCAKTPDNTALIFENIRWTYSQLNQNANKIAHYLLQNNITIEEPIGVCMSRTPELIATILGILKAGGCYVPIEIEHPIERVKKIVEDSALCKIFLNGEIFDGKEFRFSNQVNVNLIQVCDILSVESIENTRNPMVKVDSNNAAYIIYTSGTTGEPKGVVGTHSNTMNRCFWMWKTYPFGEGELCCQKTSINFVDSVWEIFGPLLSGIPLMVIPDGDVRNISKFVKILKESDMTRIVLVPSLLNKLLDELSMNNNCHTLSELKFCMCSGELLPLELIKKFYDTVPQGRLINLYGSSEIGADVSYYETLATDEITGIIGRPISNVQMYILDDHLNPVPIGVKGEIYVSGLGLSRGYYNRQNVTATQFIPNPFAIINGHGNRLFKTGDFGRYLPNGNIQYLGRMDYQVKLRGIRIEIQEIEAQLEMFSFVDKCIVEVRGEAQKRTLVAYISAKKEVFPEIDFVRDQLRKFLPIYMIPSHFILLDEFPTSVNGKIERDKLPEIESLNLKVEYIAPQTPTEEILQQIWNSVFEMKQISIRHSFFDLGGDSLIATSLIARVKNQFDVELPISNLFESPTIEQMAEMIDLCILSNITEEEIDRILFLQNQEEN
ncbi:non-ribosomal peptide synthetase [Bacillus wiedmannii]|uniref:non-ribosomal peptide synthetase n=1 Tax=Bacillus wiedmannii TaxID=1890302 RepID=UPI0015CF7C11|nr:non-ribosomal peptide synthetase [Bacillus wiedmannii]